MNDLKKYYSDDFRAKLKKIKLTWFLRLLLCIALVLIFLTNTTIIGRILMIFGIVYGLILLIGLICVFLNPNIIVVYNKKSNDKKINKTS